MYSEKNNDAAELLCSRTAKVHAEIRNTWNENFTISTPSRVIFGETVSKGNLVQVLQEAWDELYLYSYARKKHEVVTSTRTSRNRVLYE